MRQRVGEIRNAQRKDWVAIVAILSVHDDANEELLTVSAKKVLLKRAGALRDLMAERWRHLLGLAKSWCELEVGSDGMRLN